MPPNQTIQTLLTAATRGAEEQQCAGARVAARAAWVHETMAAWKAAQDKVSAAWDRLLEDIPDDMTSEELDALNFPDPPEQDELDIIQAQLDAVRYHDRRPRELHWTV